jgi:L-asparaginase
MQFDAFASGNYPPLAKAGVMIDYNHGVIKQYDQKKPKLHSAYDVNVAILKLFPGITEQVVDSILTSKGVKAIVMETFGSGNAPSSTWLIGALRKAVDRGIIILNVSQCPGGTVIQGRYETSKELKDAGVVGGLDMTTEAAVAKLMVLLAQHPPEIVTKLLSKPMAGELTNQ